MKEGRKDRER